MRLRGKKDCYKTAIYCRLSDEDYTKKRDVSESIENQLAICRDYIKRQPDLTETEVYLDDGRTGLNYNRAGYIAMMEAVDEGKIDCIVTKSLARLGREHAETIKLFKETFVIKCVRYIAVVDGIDFNGRITSIEIPIKVVMNDNYSMETSQNVRAAFCAKADRGEFIGSFASYGYRKDPQNKNHLLVDPAAAAIVKRIYGEFIAGRDISAIAQGLNADKIPCPSEYKKLEGLNYCNNRRLEKTNYWTYSTIKKILKNENENYIGNMVQHRTEKLAYNIDRLIPVETEAWIRKNHTHEPIISMEEKALVEKCLRQRRKVMDCSQNRNMFAGLLFCGDCGRAMTRSKRKGEGIVRCSTYSRIGKSYCSQHLIYESELEERVLHAIRTHTREALKQMDLEKMSRKKTDFGAGAESGKIKGQIENLERSYQKMLMKLSQDMIGQTDFLMFKEQYQEKRKFLEERLEILQVKEENKKKEQNGMHEQNEKNEQSEYQRWKEAFLQSREWAELSRELLVNLVDRIDVYGEEHVCRIEVSFRFQEPG